MPSDGKELKVDEREIYQKCKVPYDIVQYTDLNDLIFQLQYITMCGDTITVLEIGGHATPGGIGGITPGNAEDFGWALCEQGIVGPNTIIYLSGCNTGLGAGGMPQNLANGSLCVVNGSQGYMGGTHASGSEFIGQSTTINGIYNKPYPGSIDATGEACWKPFYPGGPAASPGGTPGKPKPGKK